MFMSSRKEKFKKNYEKAKLRRGQLVELGYPEEKMVQTMMSEGFQAPVLSKLFGKSGKQLTQKKMVEDAKLAEKTFKEQKDSKKPIRAKEIEDAAWFHNLLHDVGKYVFHRMVQFVDWTDEDMNDYEKARDKLTSFIDTIHSLIEDSGKIQRLEDENEFLGINLQKFQHVLGLTVKRVELLKWYNSMLIRTMCPSCRLESLNQMIAASATRMIPEAMASTETKVKLVG